MSLVDAIVVGGGPAGLAAAVQLARLGRSVTIVDDDAGRSLWAQVTRNYLGFPDGVPAADLRLLGQRQATGYGATLTAGRVVDARPRPDGTFALRVRPSRAVGSGASGDEALDGRPGAAENRRRERRHAARLGERDLDRPVNLTARTVVLATGVRDAWPVFPGRDRCVGVSLFWCIVCDGFEARGRRVAVVGADEEAIQTALGLRRFTDRVVLVAAPADVASRRTARLADVASAGIRVVSEEIVSWCHTDGALDRLDLRSGDALAVDMVFTSVHKQPRTRLARRLGAPLDPEGYVIVDDHGATNVPGLFAAGDVAAGHAHQVSAAVHEGSTAATAVNWFLMEPLERGDVAASSPDATA